MHNKRPKNSLTNKCNTCVKTCWPLTDFWIKRKVQDMSIHHTSLALVMECWSHCSLLKENITNSQGYVGGTKVKGPLLYKWGGIYSQRWTDPCDCSTSLMTVRLTWLFDFIRQTLGLPCYITLITTSIIKSSDVAKVTHYTNGHNTASMHMLAVMFVSSCCVIEWWLCSWCTIASPRHGKVRGVFNGFVFAWLLMHVHVSPSLADWYASCVRPTMRKYSSMHSFFIPYVTVPCLIHVAIFAIIHDETKSNPEIP